MGARPLSLITYDVLVTVSWIREILPQVISVTQKIVLTSLRHVNAAADNLTRNELYLLCLTPMNFLAIILLTKWELLTPVCGPFYHSNKELLNSYGCNCWQSILTILCTLDVGGKVCVRFLLRSQNAVHNPRCLVVSRVTYLNIFFVEGLHFLRHFEWRQTSYAQKTTTHLVVFVGIWASLSIVNWISKDYLVIIVYFICSGTRLWIALALGCLSWEQLYLIG